jgi:hypothetical protein
MKSCILVVRDEDSILSFISDEKEVSSKENRRKKKEYQRQRRRERSRARGKQWEPKE